MRFKAKPWITLSFQKSISVKNKLLTKFTNIKDPILKEETHIEYKNYRNLLSTLINKNKQTFYNKYFETNWNNIKNTRKGIKSLISLKTVASSAPTVPSHDNCYNITNLNDTAKAFKSCFASIAKLTTHKYLTDLKMSVIVQYFCNLLAKKK